MSDGHNWDLHADVNAPEESKWTSTEMPRWTARQRREFRRWKYRRSKGRHAARAGQKPRRAGYIWTEITAQHPETQASHVEEAPMSFPSKSMREYAARNGMTLVRHEVTVKITPGSLTLLSRPARQRFAEFLVKQGAMSEAEADHVAPGWKTP